MSKLEIILLTIVFYAASQVVLFGIAYYLGWLS